MIVFVDGYNVLKHAYPHEDHAFSAQRDLLIEELSFYKKKRSELDITVVFDGGFEKKAERQIHKGVVVIFSGQKQSADEWIVDHVEQKKGYEIVVVTRDKQLGERCKLYGAEIIDTGDFYNVLQDVIMEGAAQVFEAEELIDEGLSRTIGKKGASDSDVLDLLMSHVDVSSYYKDDSMAARKEQPRKSPSKRASKHERIREKKLKKLK